MFPLKVIVGRMNLQVLEIASGRFNAGVHEITL